MKKDKLEELKSISRKEKSSLTNINKIRVFNKIIKKLTIDSELTYKENTYILGCAISFLKYYELDRRCTSYLEFAYYIILKYSIKNNDYKPLYDFATNFGFYPISKEIIKNNLIDDLTINDCIIDIKIDKYKNRNYFETYEQNKVKKEFLSSDSLELSYIAPTSFGKSSIILDHIKRNIKSNKKIAIIVPSKSLLIQTYRMIKTDNINLRLIIHDEMYNGEDEFIAIFTQERALRLLKNNYICFDILYIDEAHNLFNKNTRSILLSRLIKINYSRNKFQSVVYLSPLIANSDNLKHKNTQNIIEKRINYNIKECEYYEYMLNGEIRKYNRFVNEFYTIGFKEHYFDYISEVIGEKNFVYIRSPKKIEMFAKELYEKSYKVINNENVLTLIRELENIIHKEFYINTLLKKGIIYLHGKLPDLIKEYLEFKYKEINELNFVIANTVILEGINLPIDTLFILSTYNLNKNELVNLIGRVNRLDKIFNTGTNKLNKLLPQIYFINTEKYNRKKSKMESKIKNLRSRVFDDCIKNPILENFDIDKLHISDDKKEEKKIEFEEIKKREEFICNDIFEEKDKLFKYLIESGISDFYDINSTFISILLKKIENIKSNEDKWNKYDVIEKVYLLFISKFKNISDFEFERLKNEKARNYYRMYINNRDKSLKYNINSLVEYFNKRVLEGDSMFYIGESYGEFPKNTEAYQFNNKNVYIDLSKKNYKEKVNYAIIKLKIEEDFVNYKLSKFVIMLYDYKLITEEEYDVFIYGTKSLDHISLIKSGLTLSLISKLEKDNQLKNLYFDKYKNLKANKEFYKYKENLTDFCKFELERIL